MALDFTDPAFQSDVARLHPYSRVSLARAGTHALRLHAHEVGPEHWITVVLEDEESAAHRAVLHAFADPESVAAEALAMSEGFLVTGSSGSLPFSAGSVRALSLARGRVEGTVEASDLLRAATSMLPEDRRSALAEADLVSSESVEAAGDPTAEARGGLLRDFSEGAKRALSLAARVADRAQSHEITPAHLIGGLFEADAGLASAPNPANRLHSVLSGRMDDPTPPPERTLAPDDRLRDLVRALAGRDSPAGSVDLLQTLHGGSFVELSMLLQRHKVSPALLERSRGAFEDPESSEAPPNQ